jgi:hypothetical protein
MLFYTKTNIRGHEGNVRYGQSATSYDYRLLHLQAVRNIPPACRAMPAPQLLQCSVTDICSTHPPIYRFG